MDKKNLLLSETKFLPEEEEIYLNSPRQDTINFIKALWHAFTNLLARVQSVDGKYYYTYTLFELFSGRNLQIVSLVNRRAMLRMAKGNTPGYLKQVLDTAQKASVDEKGNISAHILHTASLALLNDDDSTIIEFVDLENREGLPAHLLPFIRPFMKTATGLAITTGKQVLGILWGVSAFRLNREERKELTERLSSVHKAISTILEVENSAGSEPRDIARTIENIDIYSRYEKVFSIDIPYSTCPPRTVVGYSYRYACKFRTDTNFVIPTRKGFAVSLKRYLPEKPANKNTILLMIPGFFCNRGLMSILAREMAFRYRYTTFTMDLRGRSKCTMPESSREDWNVDDYIMEDFPITLDWLKTQYPNARFAIIGHRMRGMIPRLYTG
ncbi:MAG: hypothetical protein KDK45_17515, partial [Leptospiraceae bacterium]|nr:hypothetical protein [Leptospiraceae bacterium]